ncbi:hypothetical protein [Petrotoga sp. Shatin.DS.tank11.9.2.9.3]|nr:hypothetical protein [Petrotoga sp. Shatin.DS.tank11.9.2.9.3]
MNKVSNESRGGEEKIRKANEETINQIKKNITNITLEELTELVK